MLELGSFSEECHREVGVEALQVFDHLICLGEECAPMVDVWKRKGRCVEHMSDLACVVRTLRSIAQAGDVVLVKGSRGKKMWKVIDEF
jgi:UDP-N-acetylmuramoyl-tripeptide--D-alanyl-D-alanine ligase